MNQLFDRDTISQSNCKLSYKISNNSEMKPFMCKAFLATLHNLNGREFWKRKTQTWKKFFHQHHLCKNNSFGLKLYGGFLIHQRNYFSQTFGYTYIQRRVNWLCCSVMVIIQLFSCVYMLCTNVPKDMCSFFDKVKRISLW